MRMDPHVRPAKNPPIVLMPNQHYHICYHSVSISLIPICQRLHLPNRSSSEEGDVTATPWPKGQLALLKPSFPLKGRAAKKTPAAFSGKDEPTDEQKRTVDDTPEQQLDGLESTQLNDASF